MAATPMERTASGAVWSGGDGAWALAPGLRLRAYGLAVALSFASVPFLHLYLAVPLTAGELALHALDIALGTAAVAVAAELTGGAVFRRGTWRLVNTRVAALALLAAGAGVALWLLAGAHHDWLPGTAAVRAKHLAAGYGDMGLRILPFAGLLALAVFQLLRVGAMERALRAARARGPAAGERGEAWVLLRAEGCERRVPVQRIQRVRSQENYCEYWLAGGDDSASPERHLVRSTLAEALEELPADAFVQTHRSHLVGLAHVRELSREGRQHWLGLAGGERVPVARARLSHVRQQLRPSATGPGALPTGGPID